MTVKFYRNIYMASPLIRVSMIEDVKNIHSYWMDLLYDRHRQPHPVLGKEIPNSRKGRFFRKLWLVIGVIFSVVTYPTLLTGLAVRFVFIKKVNKFIRNNGIAVALLTVSSLWMCLIGLSYYINGSETAVGVAVASTIAVTSTIVSYYTSRVGGRVTTILLSYPLAYTAILLPPVTFAVIHSGYGQSLLMVTTDIAVWLQNTISKPLMLREFISKQFDLVGYNYMVLWTIFSFIIGWLTGLIVSVSRIFR